MKRRATGVLALALAGLALTAHPATAQEPDELAGLMDRLAALWTRGDAIALARYGASPGLDLEIHGDMLGSLEGRRAEAALRQLFAGHETVRVHAGRSTRLVGAEDRAFGELIWTVRVPGAAVTERSTVFVGFVQEGRHWRISQIRILR